ncbi:TPA: 50S ribosomal protein L11 methyltransferase [Candidatus Peregrinibacteria bacterium]|nr:50S ribosomal protein L11 methyltransferase [Candidatus Peregrinibacteria bacterium]
MNYIKCTFHFQETQPWREILLTYLSDIEFDSFEQKNNDLFAYIPQKEFSEEKVNEILKNLAYSEIEFSHEKLEDKNWNAEWEKNFDPIYVEKKCIIRAPFHPKEEGFEQEVIINPQMSFGTGHHQTTYLIVKTMFGLDFENKTVLDMGSGTGILAILAEKLLCKEAVAIDIDQWAFQNTIDNIELNNCKKISVLEGGAELLTENEKYDIVLANINRNILTNDMHIYVKSMKKDAKILMSGFYTTDVQIIEKEANKNGLSLVKIYEREGWAMAEFSKD